MHITPTGFNAYTNKAPKYKYICVYTLHSRAPQSPCIHTTPSPYVYIQHPQTPFYTYKQHSNIHVTVYPHVTQRCKTLSIHTAHSKYTSLISRPQALLHRARKTKTLFSYTPWLRASPKRPWDTRKRWGLAGVITRLPRGTNQG